MATATPPFSSYAMTHQGVRDLDTPIRQGGTNPLEVNVGDAERTWSALGGGALFAAGLMKGGILGTAMLWSAASPATAT